MQCLMNLMGLYDTSSQKGGYTRRGLGGYTKTFHTNVTRNTSANNKDKIHSHFAFKSLVSTVSALLGGM